MEIKKTTRQKYKEVVEETINSTTLLSDPESKADVESILTTIKSCLMRASDPVCGWTKGNDKQERETWWWDDTVESLIKHRRKL